MELIPGWATNPVVTAVLATLGVYLALLALLWWIPAGWERVRAAQYRRETPSGFRTERGWHPVRRTSLLASVLLEWFVLAAAWVMAKVMRLGRTGVKP